MTAGLDEAKRELRREMGARRRAVSVAQAAVAGRAVAEALAGCEEYARARCVALYAALPDELPTEACCEALWARGVRTLLPRVAAGGRPLDFRLVASFRELRPGRYGVAEPPEDARPLPASRADLVLLPGVAFDARGHRLGRGGGHYDATFPPGAPAPPLFGLAYAFQLVEELPHGAHDRAVDAIVTERGLLRVAPPS